MSGISFQMVRIASTSWPQYSIKRSHSAGCVVLSYLNALWLEGAGLQNFITSLWPSLILA